MEILQSLLKKYKIYMNFIKIFVLTNIHTIIRILSLIIMNKLIVISNGPIGLALLGQFQNFANIMVQFSNLSIQSGILTKIAENSNIASQEKVSINSLFLSIIGSLISSVLIFFTSTHISRILFPDHNFIYLINIFAVFIIFYSLNIYILSVLNGLKNIKLYTLINIFLSLVSLIIVGLLVYLFELEGAIVGLIITQAIVFFIGYYLLKRNYNRNFFQLKMDVIDSKLIYSLLVFGYSTFLIGLSVGLSFIIVRMIITQNLSLVEAGIWEGAIRISMYCNLLLTLPISVYFIPFFAEIKNIKKIKNEILKNNTLIFTISIFGFSCIYFLQEFIIFALFSEEFYKIKDILFIVLTGECLRILSMIYINFITAKNRIFLTVIAEILCKASFIFFSYVLIDNFQLLGIAYAYAISCFIYLVITYLTFKVLISYNHDNSYLLK